MNNITALHNIDIIVYALDNETYITGKDSKGKSLTIVFNTIELLERLDIDYMKSRASTYIKNL